MGRASIADPEGPEYPVERGGPIPMMLEKLLGASVACACASPVAAATTDRTASPPTRSEHRREGGPRRPPDGAPPVAAVHQEPLTRTFLIGTSLVLPATGPGATTPESTSPSQLRRAIFGEVKGGGKRKLIIAKKRNEIAAGSAGPTMCVRGRRS